MHVIRLLWSWNVFTFYMEPTADGPINSSLDLGQSGGMYMMMTSQVTAADKVDGARKVRRPSTVPRPVACSHYHTQRRRVASPVEGATPQAHAHSPRSSYCVGGQ